MYQILLAKLQLGDPRDFDSRLYMCSEAFAYLDAETLERLCETGLLPVYITGVMVFSVSVLRFVILGATEEDGVPPKRSVKEYALLSNGEEIPTPTYEERDENIEDLDGKVKTVDENTRLKEDEAEPTCNSAVYDKVRENVTDTGTNITEEQLIIQGRSDLVYFVGEYCTYGVIGTVLSSSSLLLSLSVANSCLYSSYFS